MSDNIVIVGYSGYAFVVTEAALSAGLSVRYYCDKHLSERNPFELTYLGNENMGDFPGWNDKFGYILGIGDNHIRNRCAKLILANGGVIYNVIHPNSSISGFFELGAGNFIGRNVAVNAFAKIGDFCILNTGCIIEHDCRIGNNVHIAPGAVLAGDVRIGDYSFIGANSVVKQGVKIGSNVTIGAGAVIVTDVLDNLMMVGNPGKMR